MFRASKRLKKLNHWQENHLARKRHVSVNNGHNNIIIENQCYVDFSNNDYLGLSHHPKISEAFSQAAKNYGFGSGSSPLIGGYSVAHAELEAAFAKWLNVDQTLFFNSGYLANVGVIQSLCHRDDFIFSDKLCHASLLDGIQLSRAQHFRYQHNDLHHLAALSKLHHPDCIITESVFSMEGDIADIPNIIPFSQKYQSDLIIDDAHGIGWLGATGKGISELNDFSQAQYTALMMPLGKAFNAIGCIVAGRHEVMETILQFSKTYRYATALPPAICAALKVTLKTVIDESWRRSQLKNNIRLMIAYAQHQKINCVSFDETPIKPILIGDNEKTKYISAMLLSKGFYVPAILPPTVPQNQSRLRLSINAHHTEQQLFSLIDIIAAELQ